jgi:serine protease Do
MPSGRLLPVLALAAAGLPAAAQDSPKDAVASLQQQVRKLIDAAEPSVVAVVASHLKYPGPPPDRTTGRLGKYTPPPQPRFGFAVQVPTAEARLDLSEPQNVADHQFGSGLVLDPAGLVLTSYHLTDGATKIFVRVASGKGSYADLLAADARSDLAVLKLLDPVPGLAPVRFGPVRLSDGPNGEPATVYRGLFVVALGHPLAAGVADGAASASLGLISNVRRRAAGPAKEDARYRTGRGLHHYGSLLQTDARITLGSSGGGLFDLDGRLVGMTAPLAAVTGAETAGGFAVPFDRNYQRIIKALRQGKEVEYGFLGVAVGETPGRGGGLAVGAVTPGTPAALAGLVGGEGGDVILAVDGLPVRDQDDLFLSVGAALAGSKVRLTVARRGREAVRDVVLVKHHNPMPWLASARPPAPFGLRVDYASTLVGLAQAAGGPSPPIEDGVLVREVEPDTPAAAKLGAKTADAAPRWLVTQVNGRPVETPDEYSQAVRGRDSVRLRVRDLDPNASPRERDIDLP